MKFLPLERCAAVYIVRNKIDGKCYIGSSVDAYNRCRSHLNGSSSSLLLRRAIKKHGRENFEAFILEKSSREDLRKCEGKWMKLFNPKYNCSFMTESGVYQHSEFSKKKMRKSALGKIVSEQARKNMSEGQKRRDQSKTDYKKVALWRVGKPLPPSTIEKMRAANLGKKLSDETRAKISLAVTGRRHSTETKAKIGKSRLGRRHTEEAKLKIGTASKARKFAR